MALFSMSHSLYAATDSLVVLNELEFLNIVRQYHPVVLSAGLEVERAYAGIQSARGGFDPTIGAGLSQKTLDGKTYYRYFNPEISIPTWYGLELVAGTEDINGERLNPEVTNGQLSYAGAKLNLNGLLMDARRATLLQAKSLLRQSLAERTLAVNKLLYEAMGAFYNWQMAAEKQRIIARSLENARARLRFVLIAYEQGARPAIDTVEAATQIIAIEQQQDATALLFQNAGLELSNYLWLPDGSPLTKYQKIVPEVDSMNQIALSALEPFIVASISNHPKLMLYQNKLDVLNIERQLKASYLLPKMSIKGLILSKGYTAPNDFSDYYLEQNSKIAAELKFPLFLREARGNYRSAKFKIQETKIDQVAEKFAIENNIREAYNEVISYNGQLRKLESLLLNYERIYNGDRLLFEGGESTLFQLNSRQNKLIETSEKMVELRSKQRKSFAGLYYAAGMLK